MNRYLLGDKNDEISRVQTFGIMTYTMKLIIKMDKIFSKTPTLIISRILMVPLANAIAFGAVATGSIKAHEAASIAPTIR